MSAKPEWLAPVDDPKCWWLDGQPIKGERMLEMWNGLDWSRAHVDMGPSVTGNLGPYWHVPFPEDGTVHRLYPRIHDKWLPAIHRAVLEGVADWEKGRYPILAPTAIEAIRFRMEQQGLKQKNLIPYIGSKGHVSEVLAGKRPLTVAMIRRLHEGLGIPLGPLVMRGTKARRAGR